MKLMTKALEARFAKLGRQDKPDAVVVAKFFTPTSNWTWYVTEAFVVLSNFEMLSFADRRLRGLRGHLLGQKVPSAKVAVDPSSSRKALTVTDVEFFGLVVGLETELGHFSLKELESVVGPLGLGIERDLHWRETTLDKVQAKLDSGAHV